MSVWSSLSVFGLRRFVLSARQAHIRCRVTVIGQPTLCLNLCLESPAEPQPHLNMVDTTVQPRVHTSSDVRLRSRCSGASVVASAVGSTTVSFVRQLVTSCAVDGGLLAATRGASASHVTSLQGTRPLTTRGMEEGGTWFQERNGRKVLKLKLGSSGCQKYWRAPRPRPRPHRRRRRRQVKKIVQAALGHQEAASAVPAVEAEMDILVLQNSLRGALHRAAAA